VAVILQEPWDSGVLYFNLEYDANALSPLSAEPCVTADEAESLVHLAVLSDRGVVHYGQVPRGSATPGSSAAGDVLVEARFEHKPCTAARVTSQPPTGVGSQVQLWDTYRGQLFWHHMNHGDYNGDGIVNINDLAPVGQHFGEVSTAPCFPDYKDRLVADGNGDGLVNLSDLTAIGQNWGNSVLGGYRVYYSNTMDSYPADVSLENGPGATLLCRIGFNLRDQSYSPPSFTVDIDPGLVTAFFWVRPVDDGNQEGIASTVMTNLGLHVPRAEMASAHSWWDTDAQALTWYYTNPGDFNQDGLVSLTDLTPIGYHWMQSGPFPEDSVGAVIDYNSDGMISLNDMSGISINWSNYIHGYNVYVSWDENHYPIANDADSVLLPIASLLKVETELGNPGYDRLSFMHMLADPEPGSYYWVRPFDYMGNEGTPSNLVVIPQ
jgi:hypothetical protein